MKQEWWDVITLVDGFMSKLDWRIRENANTTYSVQALNTFISGEVTKRYWLTKVYSEEAAKMHSEGLIHIHDTSFLGAYCVGWDLMDLLTVGFKGVPGKIESRPAKHFRPALGQAVNFMYTLQGETAGAQAFSNFDVHFAPFIHYDGLDYKGVKQSLQEFVYNMNVPTRVGFQTPFTNLTLDTTVPKSMKEMPVIVGGKKMNSTYGDFQDELDMFNKAFTEVMEEGDARGRPFTFPIPTYNISKTWDWDSEVSQGVMDMTGKYGIPYFANFVNSDLSPDDVRSMCCRLRLDTRDLKKRMGGLFASAPLTGSLGVVTLNMGRIGHISKDDDEFLAHVDKIMEVSKDSLLSKRDFVEKMTDKGLYPYSRFYLRAIKDMENQYWAHHFNTIGLIGMNEGLVNMMGENIAEKSAKKFALRVLNHMRDRLATFQEETGQIWNLEATPGEGASYRLAKIDKQRFKDIHTAGIDYPYYTNSTWLPVNYTGDIFDVMSHQEELQTKYTGGTVVHAWLGESADPEVVGNLVKKAIHKFRNPYYTITPTYSICPIHGYLSGKHEQCPYPHSHTELVSAGLLKGNGLSKFEI